MGRGQGSRMDSQEGCKLVIHIKSACIICDMMVFPWWQLGGNMCHPIVVIVVMLNDGLMIFLWFGVGHINNSPPWYSTQNLDNFSLE
jgi:hypothetical protein